MFFHYRTGSKFRNVVRKGWTVGGEFVWVRWDDRSDADGGDVIYGGRGFLSPPCIPV